ncbi:protein transport protein SEC13 B-like [Histomonas meleagridis]|uniref:protein transport protein SEC13-like B-like n=1 Tax=Histomonas meleagridis TaxID=135588 RepID=UPI00355A3941|nr:protein transport protein SEC13 B-like [Histomonas meleagridis]KAH0798910.1 protein transport protein SEC13-like B-like [Histomonas meleagridis]
METNYNSTITSIDTDEYGHNVAVSSVSGVISILNSQNLQKISDILNLDSVPYSLDYSQSSFGPILACGFADGTVRLYQANREIQRFEPQKGAILSVAFHPSKCIVAAASLCGTFAVYSKVDNKWTSIVIPASPLGVSSIAWGSDLDALQTLILGGVDGVVRVFKSAGSGWEFTCSAQVHNGWIRQLSTPKIPQVGIQKVATCGDDNIASILKINGNNIETTFIDIDSPANGISFAMVDKVIVMSHKDGKTTTWSEDDEGKWVLSKDN